MNSIPIQVPIPFERDDPCDDVTHWFAWLYTIYTLMTEAPLLWFCTAHTQAPLLVSVVDEFDCTGDAYSDRLNLVTSHIERRTVAVL